MLYTNNLDNSSLRLGLISHKLLRWLVPYFLIALFVINLLLLYHTFYHLALVLQLAFYTLALAGYVWQRNGKSPRIFGILILFLSGQYGGTCGSSPVCPWQKIREVDPSEELAIVGEEQLENTA